MTQYIYKDELVEKINKLMMSFNVHLMTKQPDFKEGWT